MIPLRMAGMALIILSLGACSGKKEVDPETEKLIGIWDVTEPHKRELKGARLEFFKNGKMTNSITAADGSIVKVEGKFIVDGNSIRVTHKEGGEEVKDKIKIKKLTETTLITEDKMGDVDEFKKQKSPE